MSENAASPRPSSRGDVRRAVLAAKRLSHQEQVAQLAQLRMAIDPASRYADVAMRLSMLITGYGYEEAAKSTLEEYEKIVRWER